MNKLIAVMSILLWRPVLLSLLAGTCRPRTLGCGLTPLCLYMICHRCQQRSNVNVVQTIFSFALARCAKNLNFRAHYGGSTYVYTLILRNVTHPHRCQWLVFTPTLTIMFFIASTGTQACAQAPVHIDQLEHSDSYVSYYYYYCVTRLLYTELLEMQVVLYRYSTLQLLLLRRMREAQKVMSTCADLAKTASIAEHA